MKMIELNPVKTGKPIILNADHIVSMQIRDDYTEIAAAGYTYWVTESPGRILGIIRLTDPC